MYNFPPLYNRLSLISRRWECPFFPTHDNAMPSTFLRLISHLFEPSFFDLKGTVRAWHSSSLAHLKTIRVAQAWVTDIAYFPMSNRLATSCIDRSISFFDANSYEQVWPLSLFLVEHIATIYLSLS